MHASRKINCEINVSINHNAKQRGEKGEVDFPFFQMINLDQIIFYIYEGLNFMSTIRSVSHLFPVAKTYPIECTMMIVL